MPPIPLPCDISLYHHLTINIINYIIGNNSDSGSDAAVAAD
jgi:hypothetical protein